MAAAMRWACVLILVPTALASAQETKYSVKVEKAGPPKDLDESIRKVLGDNAVQFLDPKGTLIAEIWLRKEVPAKATAEQVKSGVSYREIAETTLLGAVRFSKAYSDYRQQKVKAGTYTLRLAFQPQNGDHMGVAPYPEFCLLVAASMDKTADTIKPKELPELSATSIGTSHAAVFLLFPNAKAGPLPHLETRPNSHVILSARQSVRAGTAEGILGIGLTLVGHSE
jgi:hypothetical protein